MEIGGVEAGLEMLISGKFGLRGSEEFEIPGTEGIVFTGTAVDGLEGMEIIFEVD